MGMSEFYGPSDWDESIATINRAIDIGVTFLDTAALYGAGHNEVLVGRAAAHRRGEVQIATKFGIDRSAGNTNRRYRGAHEYVKRSAEDSLLRLGTDVIDLYYAHRPPQDVEIEETVGAMAELVKEGKVRCLGLSEVNNELLRRAARVHPISAVQSEYSLWTRDAEHDALDAMRELGVALVAYSPLDEKDFRRHNPRFQADNQTVADTVRQVADAKGVTPAQLALAWVYAQQDRLGVPVISIPGTRRVTYLEQNAAAMDITLSADDLAVLDPLSAQVAGSRY
jgi:aryl-alcohol dehydrogenase-like predicted oxidoreductase